MRYSVSNQPLVCMQTQSTCYKSTTTMKIEGVLWHSTGANNPNLKRYVQPSDNAADREMMLKLLGTNTYKNDWNHITHQAGLNAWIGKLADGSITTVQTMPWEFRPWGCGSGSKGSCNTGWIQFEICEDDLSNKDYFDAVYKEACELTAYLCDLYNIDPNGYVERTGVKVPTILCHADSYALKFGSNHGDVLHWFKKYGKTMDNVRADVTKLLATRPTNKDELTIPNNTPVQNEAIFNVNDIVAIKEAATYYSGKTIPSWVMRQQWIVSQVDGERVVINKSTTTDAAINSPMHQKDLVLIQAYVAPKPMTLYRVRMEWSNASSQVGAYTDLSNAVKKCEEAGYGYHVFDENGKTIYTSSALPPEPVYKVGETVTLLPGATYSTGSSIPQWVFKSTLYVREVRSNTCVISTQKTGAVTGVVAKKFLQQTNKISTSDDNISGYNVMITATSLNVRSGPGTNYAIITTVAKNNRYTIIEERNGWGKLKSGAGWISLNYTKKLE